jgi:hypothetical protein
VPWNRLLIAAALLALSCTRMPTAPRGRVDVHGTIVGPSGEPVRAVVLFYPREAALSGSDYLAAGTDAQGAYSLQMVPGLYELRIPPPRHGWLGHVSLVKVSPENRQIDFEFHGFRVSGRLLDPAGDVVTHGGVIATAESPDQSYAEDYFSEGTYSLLLPRGTYSLAGQGTDFYSPFTPTTVRSVSIASDTTLDIHLVGFPIEGTVLGMDGAPLQSAMVDAYPARTHTDASGRYLLYAPAGPHAMRCFPPQWEILPQLEVLSISGPTTVDFNFTGLVHWTGTVRRADNDQPLPICYVLASVLGPDNREALNLASATGDFNLYLSPKLSYELQVYASADLQAPIYYSIFRATADTTFDLRVTPPPNP